MKAIKATWTGIRPLIMSNAQMIDWANPYVKRLKQLNQEKPRKSVPDSYHEQVAQVEWEGALYWDKELGLYIPSDNIEKALKEGASKLKLGKAAEASSYVSEPLVKVETVSAYPKDLTKLYETPEYQMRSPVRVPPRTGARIMKVRPMIPTGWKLSFTLEFDDDDISGHQLIQAMNKAGRLIGLGVWRPKFGRFLVEAKEVAL